MVTGRPFRDRLAVWTYAEADQDMACGDPGVTDEERVAAGRPTLADLERTTVARNRRRAAERGRSRGALPDGVAHARVWWPREPADLRAHLGAGDLAVWAEGDVLHVVWRGAAEKVVLGGGLGTVLWPVSGTDDLWEASVQVRALERCAMSLYVVATPAVREGPQALVPVEWHGSAAQAPPTAADPLRGRLATATIDSRALGTPRDITTYLPPVGPDDGVVTGCVLADGQSVEHYAPVLEHAMLTGAIPRTAVVGVHTVLDPTSSWPDTRSQEYVPGENEQRFSAHLAFVVDEVLPWCRREAGIAARTWTAAGSSNGAAWAIAAAQRVPEVFPRVVALSPGVVPRRVGRRARTAGVRHYLAAGLLEPGFLAAARKWSDQLRRARLDVRLDEVHGGHDRLWWRRHLVTGLAHLDQTGR